jgi:hypothetical protein
MASIFVRAYPVTSELVLWVIGPLDETERHSLVEALHPFVGSRLHVYREACLSEFAPQGAGRYRMSLVTPWVLEKIAPHRQQHPVDDFATRLCQSIERRMQKFTALAVQHVADSGLEEIKRLLGFAARHIAQRLLPDALRIESCTINVSAFGIPSASTGRLVPHVVVDPGGFVTMNVGLQALPWLGLLSIAGGGESADKGFGGVSLSPY